MIANLYVRGRGERERETDGVESIQSHQCPLLPFVHQLPIKIVVDHFVCVLDAFLNVPVQFGSPKLSGNGVGKYIMANNSDESDGFGIFNSSPWLCGSESSWSYKRNNRTLHRTFIYLYIYREWMYSDRPINWFLCLSILSVLFPHFFVFSKHFWQPTYIRFELLNCMNTTKTLSS